MTDSTIEHDTALGVDAVTAAYDELAAFVASFAERPRARPAVCATAAAELAHESRLLDDSAHAAWLDLWLANGVFWVPLRPGVSPTGDQSYLLDDRRRLGERIAWQRGPASWAQQPASATVRSVGSVEAWEDDGALLSRSAIMITEHRGDRVATFAGIQLHRFEPRAVDADASEWALRYKVLQLPALAGGTTNLAFLL